MNKYFGVYFIALTLYGLGMIAGAQDLSLSGLNRLEEIKPVILRNGNEAVVIKFAERPLFEIIENLENNVMTIKVFEAKSRLKKTIDAINNKYFERYLIKKISETEFWILFYFNVNNLSFRTISERIEDGFLAFEFFKKTDSTSVNVKNTLIRAIVEPEKTFERLILYFNAAPEYKIKEYQLPHYRLEIELFDTTVNLHKKIESYSPNIIKPIQFSEENGTTRVVIEPFRYGLNYQIKKEKNALIVRYSESPLSSQISAAEIQRFYTKSDEGETEAEYKRNEALRKLFAEAEVQYREASYGFSERAFLEIYRQTPNSKLGIQSLFRSADSTFGKYKPNPLFSIQRDVINTYLNAVNIALETGHKGADLYRALSNIASIYQKHNYYEEALSYYQKINEHVDEGPFAAEANYFVGEIYHKKRRYKKALAVFEKFIKTFKQSYYYVYALYMTGDSYFHLKDYPKALEYFTKAQTIDSRIPEAYPELLYDMAEVYLEAGYAEKARSLYDTLLDKYPDSPYINYIAIRLGDYLRDSDQKKSAIQIYATVIDKLPYELGIAARMRIANIFSEDVSGDEYQKAIGFYDYLIDRFPQTISAEEAKFRIAVTLGFQKKYALSIKEFELFNEAHSTNYYVKSNEVNHKILDVINAAVIDHYLKGEHIIVAQFYNNYLKYISADTIRYHYFFSAASAEKSGLFKVANSIYKSVLNYKERNHKNGGADNKRIFIYNEDAILYKMIVNHLKMQNIDAAFQMINRLIEQYPSSIYRPLAMKLKADTLYAQNNTEPAVKLYQSIIDKYADSSNPLLFDPVNQSLGALGELYGDIGKFSDALKYYQMTLDNFKNPMNDSRVPKYIKNAMYRIGEMHYENDELDDAKSSLLHAVRSYPNYERMPWAQYFIGQIYLRQKQPDQALKVYEDLAKLANPQPSQLWDRLIKEGLLEAQEKINYVNYLKQIPNKNNL